MLYYGPEIASDRSPSGGREQSHGRRKPGNKGSGHVERICFEEPSRQRMFCWSDLGETLRLLWLQLRDSPGHAFF